jgi:hypothetical protein
MIQEAAEAAIRAAADQRAQNVRPVIDANRSRRREGPRHRRCIELVWQRDCSRRTVAPTMLQIRVR